MTICVFDCDSVVCKFKAAVGLNTDSLSQNVFRLCTRAVVIMRNINAVRALCHLKTDSFANVAFMGLWSPCKLLSTLSVKVD